MFVAASEVVVRVDSRLAGSVEAAARPAARTGGGALGGGAGVGAGIGMETISRALLSRRDSSSRLSTVSMLAALRDSMALSSATSIKIFFDTASRRRVSQSVKTSMMRVKAS